MNFEFLDPENVVFHSRSDAASKNVVSSVLEANSLMHDFFKVSSACK